MNWPMCLSEQNSPPREEGWLRAKENAAKPPKLAQTGWSLASNCICERPTRPLQQGGIAPFCLMSRPPLLTRRRIRLTRPLVNSFTSSQTAATVRNASINSERIDRVSRSYQNILVCVDHVCLRSIRHLADVAMPENFSVCRIERDQIP